MRYRLGELALGFEQAFFERSHALGGIERSPSHGREFIFEESDLAAKPSDIGLRVFESLFDFMCVDEPEPP